MVVLLTRHLKSTGEDRRRIKGVWISLLFPLFSADTPDVKRFAQVVLLKSLTLEGKCLRRRAKPAHLVRHLPIVWHPLRNQRCCLVGSLQLVWTSRRNSLLREGAQQL